ASARWRTARRAAMAPSVSPVRTTYVPPAAAAGALTVAGIGLTGRVPGARRRVPTDSTLGLRSPLARTGVPWLTPRRAAIAPKVSPVRTTYVPVTAGTPGAAVAPVPPGRRSRRPACTTFGFGIALSSAMAAMLTPCRAAMVASDSPGRTVTDSDLAATGPASTPAPHAAPATT